MKKYWYIFAVGVICSLFLIGLALTRNHWWLQTKSVKVYFNGELAPDSEAYQSVDGDLIVWVKKGADNLGEYIILRKEKRVGVSTPTEIKRFVWSQFSLHYPVYVRRAGTEATFTYAKIVFDDQSVDFELRKGENIRVVY